MVEPHETELLTEALTVRRGVTRLNRRLLVERPRGSLSTAKLSVLASLRRKGPLSPSELAALDRVRPQTLTRTLAELESAGLIERATDPNDRRRILLRIADEGVRVQNEDMRERDAWLARAMAATLTPTERKLVGLAAELLDRLASDEDARALRTVS